MFDFDSEIIYYRWKIMSNYVKVGSYDLNAICHSHEDFRGYRLGVTISIMYLRMGQLEL